MLSIAGICFNSHYIRLLHRYRILITSDVSCFLSLVRHKLISSCIIVRYYIYLYEGKPHQTDQREPQGLGFCYLLCIHFLSLSRLSTNPCLCKRCKKVICHSPMTLASPFFLNFKAIFTVKKTNKVIHVIFFQEHCFLKISFE